MARFASQAEYFRHHRRCFELALELKVTPREAELELQKREVRERFDATHARYLTATQFPPAQEAGDGEGEPREPWMMRD